jgi:hypothetical protein
MSESNRPGTAPHLQHRITTGWLVMALTLVMVSVSQLMQAAIQTDFSEFVYHPGPGGWWATCILFMAYGVVALAVCHGDARWFRWLGFMLGVTALGYTAGHHVTHVAEGFVGPTFGPFGVIHLHHVASLVVCVQSFRWARG